MFAGALAAGGMVVTSAAPAFAATILTCTGLTGGATLSPGISNTPNQQTISDPANVTGCSGTQAGSIVKGTTTFNNLKTLATGNPPSQPTCNGLLNPSPNGTLIASGGAATTVWKDSGNVTQGTSTGSLKLKSTGAVAQAKAIIKITSGKFFQAGKTTKAKVTVNFAPSPGQTCPTLTHVDTTNANNLVITQV